MTTAHVVLNMAIHISKYLRAFQHLFLPHNCKGCGADYISTAEYLCSRCISSLPVTQFTELPGNPVEKIFAARIHFFACAALFYFTKSGLLQYLLVQLKYNNDRAAGYFMGRQLGTALKQSARFQSVDLIIPLPLHPKKEYQRGYNQATLIGEGIQSVWTRPLVSDAVTRLVFTKTQTKESRTSRWQNMEGVFRVTDPDQLKGRHILLIDDVVTTGASIEACGAVILEVPGTRLSIATVAFTI